VAITRWHREAARHRSPAGPDRNAEYLFWQTLVGAWPIDANRLGAYMEKATREAKQHTSWVDPATDYDEALQRFVRGVLTDRALTDDVERFVELVVGAGRSNSLAQKLVQLTMPGVPDVYQGSECWDLSLVDPDNRRPVDFALRRSLLLALDQGGSDLPSVADDSGAAKLLVVSRALRLRREHPEWFGRAGRYEPLPAAGPAAGHCLAFARADAVVTVTTRLPVGLGRAGGWGDTRLRMPARGRWRDALTGRTSTGDAVQLADVLSRLPVALLVRAE
jgi:(1->4)-alpha-D-glucan 1-alpha-D-glucosylmutase